MLELTGRTIDQVAWDVGYQDAGSFRKVFQRVMDLSRETTESASV
jgi:transcriptional regulator GlxA family with amidase domain